MNALILNRCSLLAKSVPWLITVFAEQPQLPNSLRQWLEIRGWIRTRDLGKRFPIQRAGAASQLYGLSRAVCSGFSRCTGTSILGVSYLKLPGVCLCCFSCCCCNGCIAVEKKRGGGDGEKEEEEEGRREGEKEGRKEGGREEGTKEWKGETYGRIERRRSYFSISWYPSYWSPPGRLKNS